MAPINDIRMLATRSTTTRSTLPRIVRIAIGAGVAFVAVLIIFCLITYLIKRRAARERMGARKSEFQPLSNPANEYLGPAASRDHGPYPTMSAGSGQGYPLHEQQQPLQQPAQQQGGYAMPSGPPPVVAQDGGSARRYYAN